MKISDLTESAPTITSVTKGQQGINPSKQQSLPDPKGFFKGAKSAYSTGKRKKIKI